MGCGLSEAVPGDVCLRHLGSERRRRLFLARDRLGKKPLVYWTENGRLLFASEIKSLLQAPGIERKVNLHALHSYLAVTVRSLSRRASSRG